METLVINTVDDLTLLTDELLNTNVEIKIITPSIMHQLYMPVFELEMIIITIQDFLNNGIKIGFRHEAWYDEYHKSKIHILSKEE